MYVGCLLDVDLLSALEDTSLAHVLWGPLLMVLVPILAAKNALLVSPNNKNFRTHFSETKSHA